MSRSVSHGSIAESTSSRMQIEVPGDQPTSHIRSLCGPIIGVRPHWYSWLVTSLTRIFLGSQGLLAKSSHAPSRFFSPVSSLHSCTVPSCCCCSGLSPTSNGTVEALDSGNRTANDEPLTFTAADILHHIVLGHLVDLPPLAVRALQLRHRLLECFPFDSCAETRSTRHRTSTISGNFKNL